LSLPSSGKLGDQRGTGYGADAADRLQDRIERAEALLDVRHHLRLDIIELSLDRLNDGFQTRVQLFRRDLQALSFGRHHGHELAPARDQRGQPLLLGIVHGTQEATQVGTANQRLAELGLPWIDHCDCQAGTLQCTSQCRLIAARGLQDHQARPQRLQRRGDRRVPFSFVVEPLRGECRADDVHIDMRLRHVDARYH